MVVTEERKVLFVTVGTTALLAEMLPAELRWRAQQFEADVKNWARSKPLSGPLAGRREQLYSEAVNAHRDVWLGVERNGFAELAQSMKQTSAEMTSSYLLATHPKHGIGKFRGGRDRMVLLASDTHIGELAARVNAGLMHQFLLEGGCGCGADFLKDGLGANGKCPSVKVEVVEGMEAKEGLGRIGGTLKEICQRQAEGYEKVLFNITGGYKGAIPLVTWLSLEVFGKRPPLFYQHEEMLSVVRISLAAEGEPVVDELGVEPWP